MNELVVRHCKPCEGGQPLARDQAESLLRQVPEWSIDPPGQSISRTYSFKNFHQTMAFVNAVAWVAHQEDHHPDLEVSYRSCRVRYSTHAMGGLSENDFICAAKVSQLLAA